MSTAMRVLSGDRLMFPYVRRGAGSRVLSPSRVTHASVDSARRAELEKGILKSMDHSMYQAYLSNSGLDSSSPEPSGPWGRQIEAMVREFGPALKEMGLIK